MLLVLADREYDIDDALGKATLTDLIDLKVKTGIGLKTLRLGLVAMGRLEGAEDWAEDIDIMRALGALVWLCRRRAGERLTVDEACDVSVRDIDFRSSAPVVEPDPT